MVDNTCSKGSDVECERYGEYACCAHVKYAHKGENLDFYSCASKYAIDAVDGRIYDSMGFVGTWYCADAVSIVGGVAVAILGLVFV
jgi:hypothetical protein